MILDCYVYLIISFLRKRTFRVNVVGGFSITAAICQRNVLELLLSSMYVNDVPKLLA